ncbi:MAG: cytochrome c-type biogenesis protein CcmH [Solirubrobacteraceae bacterium]|nr:cytochrome c-type biogenesis protein CcmH [Solirubrobacteraceae bacterium]
MTRGLLIALLALLLAPAAAFGQASLPDIEDEVMCPTCNMPLNTAQSPQADDQRAFIRELIADGQDKEQIKAALVSEYGQDVLADPDDEGFGIMAYIGPIVLLGGLAIGLLALLPRRRRDRAPAAPAAATGPALSAEDTARLDADLARYDA